METDDKIETDVRVRNPGTKDSWVEIRPADPIGQIRREFLCNVAASIYAIPETKHFEGFSEEEAWACAESLLREGQKRGYLP